jgi:DNA-binding transcriptional ArsR family regulator
MPAPKCTVGEFVEFWNSSSSLMEVAGRVGLTCGERSAVVIVCERARRLRNKGLHLKPYRRRVPAEEAKEKRARSFCERSAMLKEHGLCVCCKGEAEEGKTRCRPCLDDNARDRAELRNKRATSGRPYCTRCLRWRDRASKFKLCRKCRTFLRWRRPPKHRGLAPNAVYESIEDMDMPTVYDLAEKLKTTDRTVRRHLARLRREGRIVAIEPDKWEGETMVRYEVKRG